MTDRIGRRLVQLGFLLLFLYPFVPLVYRGLTYREAPVVLSWLLAWDPLLLIGRLPRLGQGALMVGAPLLLLALTLVGGRFFCGWICPLGTVLDLVRPLAFWQKSVRASRMGRLQRALTLPGGNSYLKYLLLLAGLALAVFSLKLIGLLDPLVLFHRVATGAYTNWFALRSPGFDLYVTTSLLIVAIVGLELWRPRFWCRHLCPQGALLGWLSRWTLLNRRVSGACTYCGRCRSACPMNAIPKEPHNTNYQECHFCLACEAACPEKAISFGWGGLAWAEWRARRRTKTETGRAAPAGGYVRAERGRLERILGLKVGRREAVGGAVTGVGALALWPLLRLTPNRRLLRPPGALPEEQFVATCILCQECMRVCPTRGLKPAFLEAGLRSLGTPYLVPRAGGCHLPRNCPNLCARACPVGAIQPIPAKEMRIGLAWVDRRACLAWDQGARCLVCVEACPTEAATPHQGRVTVNPLKCTGCGICEQVCPVVGSAIHVLPLGGA